jgi:putative phosphoesterase
MKDNKDKLIAVRGNCDFCCDVKDELFFEIEKLKILLTHGDKYSVKNNLKLLKYRAEELKADIVIYGHTHINELMKLTELHILTAVP